jgi:hypothetical protein
MNFIFILPSIPRDSNSVLSYILLLTLFIRFYLSGMVSNSKDHCWIILKIVPLSKRNNNNNNNNSNNNNNTHAFKMKRA